MRLGREGTWNAHMSSFPMWVSLCPAGREGRHFPYGTPAIPIIYFWRGGYRKPFPPVSIEITERGGFYGAKRASRWEKLPRRDRKSRGGGHDTHLYGIIIFSPDHIS